MKNVEKEKCACCGHIIERRKITLISDMVVALRLVYKWCNEKEIHEFSRKDVKHLFTNENQVARFGDWKYFGGIIYTREKRGAYGINIPRAYEFLSGRLAVNTVALKDPINHTVSLSEPKKIKDIRNISDFLDSEGDFVPEYIKRSNEQ